jgi:phage-related protein
VRREFVPFDENIIRKEIDALPAKDADKLAALMLHYQGCSPGNPLPAQVDSYGDGLFRLRHFKPIYQGRLLYFVVDRSLGYERLVIVLVYKKEGQKTPANIIDIARRRKQEWLEQRKKN